MFMAVPNPYDLCVATSCVSAGMQTKGTSMYVSRKKASL
jgi:hypothetical protein